MATANEAVDLLRSIDASLKALLALQRGATPPAIASDADLDGQYGDPIVRAKDPRDWHGESQLGKPFSECPAPYLDLVAARLDFFAEKAEAENTLTTTGKPVAPFNRRDAARARGWAARIRAGWKPPAAGRELSADEALQQRAASPFPSDDDGNIAF